MITHKCIKCSNVMQISDDGIHCCEQPSHTEVVCSCGHRMKLEAKYNKELKKLQFWLCPHCLRRW